MARAPGRTRARPAAGEGAPVRPPRERRALTHAGGAVEVQAAEPRDARLLEHALRVSADEREVMAHVHGFHAYPARLHPQTAGRLIAELSAGPARVLDPFCGSGTVLVEGRLRGCACHGVDANPLAVELAWLKSAGLGTAQLDGMREAGARVVEHAEARRQARAGPSRRYGASDRELFDPHILLELDGLRGGIAALAAGPVRRALWLVLSSMLVKLSRRESDTSGRRAARRLASGFAIRLFSSKLSELVERLGDYAARLPPGAPACGIRIGDARALRHLGPASIDLVVTSPPYPGVYDYADHHALRLRWLGLDQRGLVRREIGSRRQLSALAAAEALRLWERDLLGCLAELGRVLAPGGAVAWIMADSALRQRPVLADEVVSRLAPRAGLRVRARASQTRPHFHPPMAGAFDRIPRREWLFLLAPERAGARRSTPVRPGMDRRRSTV